MTDYKPRSFVPTATAHSQSDCALELKANGTKIEGGIAGANDKINKLIKITQWENFVWTAREAGSGLATGRRQYTGINLIGPISKAAPLLFRALCNNEVVEGSLKCFRLNDAGGKENHLNLDFSKARISNYLLFTSPIDGSMYYQFGIHFTIIKYTWTDGGIEFEDHWTQNI